MTAIWAGVSVCWVAIATIWFALGNPAIGSLCAIVAVCSSMVAHNFARRK